MISKRVIPPLANLQGILLSTTELWTYAGTGGVKATYFCCCFLWMIVNPGFSGTWLLNCAYCVTTSAVLLAICYGLLLDYHSDVTYLASS